TVAWHLREGTRKKWMLAPFLKPYCGLSPPAVLIYVLDYFKLTAKPLSVIATIFNPAMSERIEKEGMPTLEQAVADWFPRGCYSLAVGLGEEEPGKWPGHLVATLGGKVLIDLTLDQADRPKHGIELPMPIVAPFPAEFLSDEGEICGLVNGCRVVYRARPEDRSFERSRDWTMKRRRDAMVGAAIRR